MNNLRNKVQLLGNVGRQVLPNRDIDPGNPRGQ